MGADLKGVEQGLVDFYQFGRGKKSIFVGNTLKPKLNIGTIWIQVSVVDSLYKLGDKRFIPVFGNLNKLI